ncbi:MAG: class I SAM-dependent methyltransferase [Actinobacteria bacterium]|nr:MAG: class I SAM-dependent methyltransferase [Actinomycetota bacterium]
MTRLYTDDAELYDILFDWDVEEEVDWLFERLGRPASVLEPGCGSGRMLESFARRGVEVVGIDLSPQMVELAHRRFGDHLHVSLADMTDFDLGRTFDAAISPINTLLHLTPERLARHLECMSRHLEPRGSYLVQVGLIDQASQDQLAGSHWEESRGDTKLRADWTDEELDFERGVSRQRSRIEVLEGPRAGEVIEEIHDMTLWTPATWAAAIDASPFSETETYDAGQKGSRPRMDADATGGLLWHLLQPR